MAPRIQKIGEQGQLGFIPVGSVRNLLPRPAILRQPYAHSSQITGWGHPGKDQCPPCGQKAVEYERYINRSSDNEIKERWESKNGVTFTEKADMDIDSFKKAVDGVDEWFVNELKSQGYEDGQDLVDLFTK